MPTLDPEATAVAGRRASTPSGRAAQGGAELDGIFDLRILNSVLKAEGKPAVSAAGVGQD